MNNAWLTVCTSVLIAVAAPAAMAQQVYHDSGHGFTIEAPQGWVRATQAALATFPLSPPQGGTTVSVVGYVRGTSGDVLKAPFMIVEARRQPFQLDGMSWDELAGRLGLTRFEDLRENGQFDSHGRYRGDGLSPPTLVEGDELILVEGTINGADGTPLYLCSTSFPGRREIIRVSVFLPAVNNENMQRDAESIRDSFMFDPGYDFNPPAERSSGGGGSRYGRRGPFGIGVGVVGIVAWALRRWARD